MEMHLPTKLTMYRGVTMMASLAAPVLLGFVLNWQQQVGEKINDVQADTKALASTVALMRENITDRVAVLEAEARTYAATARYDLADAQRDREIVSDRMKMLVEKIDDNADHIRRLTDKLDEVSDRLERQQ